MTGSPELLDVPFKVAWIDSPWERSPSHCICPPSGVNHSAVGRAKNPAQESPAKRESDHMGEWREQISATYRILRGKCLLTWVSFCKTEKPVIFDLKNPSELVQACYRIPWLCQITYILNK